MDVIKGVIQGVSVNTGMNKNNKPFTRWVFTINEKKYSTFDEKIGQAFKVGDNVVMTGEQKGQFWNMSTMVLASQTTLQETPQPTEQPNNDLVVDLLRQILAELKGTKPKETESLELDDGNGED